MLMELTPSTLVSLRSVSLEQRPLAVAFNDVLYRLIGTIPGPILMGYIFDNVCLSWKKESSEGKT